MKLARLLITALLAALVAGCSGVGQPTALVGEARPSSTQTLRGYAAPAGGQPAPLTGNAQQVVRP